VTTIDQVRLMDASDPLAAFRDRFFISDPDQCYLDGNSLGRMPQATLDAVDHLLRLEWGAELVAGWEHWLDMALRVGDRLGRIALGAASGQVLVTDTTSVNFYRLAVAALRDRPERSTIVIDEANFPTDRYIAQGIAQELGCTLVTIPNHDSVRFPFERLTPDNLEPYLSDDVALVSLQAVNYRSGARQDVPAITERVQAAGAHMLWDAAHAAGAIDLDLDAWGVKLAVGCTYKYLNSGPGAPAWLYVAKDLQDQLRTPIDGWFAQRDQFEMGSQFDRAPGMRGFQIATPSIAGLTCVDSSLALLEEGGTAAAAAKCARGTEFMIELFDEWLKPLGFGLDTPRDSRERGGHISLTHPDAPQIALAMRRLTNVIPDFRRPNVIRVAVSPLYTSYEEIFTGFLRLRDLVDSGAYRQVSMQGTTVT